MIAKMNLDCRETACAEKTPHRETPHGGAVLLGWCGGYGLLNYLRK